MTKRVRTRWVLLPLGIAAVVFGEADDSPGLQGMGLIGAIVAIWPSARTLIARVADAVRNR
jgi:hypothetical protein